MKCIFQDICHVKINIWSCRLILFLKRGRRTILFYFPIVCQYDVLKTNSYDAQLECLFITTFPKQFLEHPIVVQLSPLYCVVLRWFPRDVTYFVLMNSASKIIIVTVLLWTWKTVRRRILSHSQHHHNIVLGHQGTQVSSFRIRRLLIHDLICLVHKNGQISFRIDVNLFYNFIFLFHILTYIIP